MLLNNLEKLLDKLENVKTYNDYYMALCPSHPDKKPSLKISQKTDGKISIYCFAGCQKQDILNALDLPDSILLPENNLRTAHNATSTSFNTKKYSLNTENSTCELVDTYDYLDKDGILKYQILRYNPKEFRVRRRDGNGGWIYNLKDTQQILYRLPELISALNEGKPVFIVEGEKDADTLCKLGLTATTAPFGANNPWLDSYSEQLKDANVAIIPDNDEAGLKHANEVASKLSGKAKSIRLVELPNVGEQGDITDWIQNGNTIQDLESLVSKTAQYEIPSVSVCIPEIGTFNSWTISKAGIGIKLEKIKESPYESKYTALIMVQGMNNESPPLLMESMTLTSEQSRKEIAKRISRINDGYDWNTIISQICHTVLKSFTQTKYSNVVNTADAVKPPQFKLEPIAPEDKTTVIYGLQKVGKGYLAILIAICIQLGWTEKSFGFNVKKGKVMYIDYEDNEAEFHRRLNEIRNAFDLPHFTINYKHCSAPISDIVNDLSKECYAEGIDTIIIDSIGLACSGSNLNAGETATRFYSAIDRLPGTKLAIGHTSKTGNSKDKSVIGSVFFENLARSIWQVTGEKDINNPSILNTTLSHKYTTRGQTHGDIKFKLEFSEGKVNISTKSIATISNVKGKSYQTMLAIVSLLTKSKKRCGSTEICTVLEKKGHSSSTIGRVLPKLLEEKKIKQDSKGGEYYV